MTHIHLSRFVSQAFSRLRPTVRGRRAFRRIPAAEALESRQLLSVTAQTIKAWGGNDFGQVSLAPTDQNYTQVTGGYRFGFGLKTDGSIAAWGSGEYSDYGGVQSNRPTGTGFTLIAAGAGNGLALSSNGTISAWGSDDQQIVSYTPSGSGYKALAGNWYNGLALTSDGTITVWGSDNDNQISNMPTGSGYTAIAAGSIYAYALASDGSLRAWGGSGSTAQVANKPTGTGFTAIAAGEYHAVALKSDGSLVSWGSDGGNVVSNTPTGTGFIAIAAGGGNSYALKNDGSIVAWGGTGGGQVSNAPTGTGYTSISANTNGGFALYTVSSNTAPTDISLSPSSVAENLASGATVGTLSTTDADSGDTFTYTLVSTSTYPDNNSFTIDGSTLKTAASFNYETGSSYTIRVRSTDNGGLWTEKTLTVSVTNTNEAPTQVSLSNVVTELLSNVSTIAAIRVADVAVTDDALGTNTVTVSGPDASSFEVVDGQLRLKAGTVLNYATKKTYSVTVNVDDTTVGGTPDASADYTLQLQGLDGLTVQNGSVGRSYVRYVDLNFNNSLALDTALASIGTANPRVKLFFGGTTGLSSTSKNLTGLVTQVGNTLKIDFGEQGVGGNRNSNLGDGVYRLRVDLDGDGVSEYVKSFHRLFGDVDGNGIVNKTDVSLVTAAVGQSYDLALDLNGDGVIDNSFDLYWVKKRVGAKVTL